MAAQSFDEALKSRDFKDVLKDPRFMRLRSFVDDVLALIEVIDDSLPIPKVRAKSINPRDGLEAAPAHRTLKVHPSGSKR